MTSQKNQLVEDISDYYNSLSSRAGYKLLLNNVRHCGLYEDDDKPWQIKKAQRQMQLKLRELLNLPPGAEVLDAGCGTGRVAIFLAKNFSYRVRGVDLLEQNVIDAKRAAVAQGLEDILKFEVGDYELMPYRKSSFDGIYTMETLVHAADAKAVLKKFYKALVPGGRLVLHEYFHSPLSEMPREISDMLTKIDQAVGMPSMQIFTNGFLAKITKEAGFEQVETLDISQQVKPLWKLFYVLNFVPYKLTRLLKLDSKKPNLMASGIVYENQKHFGYCIVSAYKPKK